MRKLATTFALGAVLAMPTSAYGEANHPHGPTTGEPNAVDTVMIARNAFTPSRLTVLTGDTVHWRNEDFAIHTVSFGDGAFSGRLDQGNAFSRRFESSGVHPYLCTIHPFMRGQIEAHAALLHAPPEAVLAGARVELHGRVAAGTTQVTLQHALAPSNDFAVLTTVGVAPDGGFILPVHPTATTLYRAVTQAGASPAARVTIATRIAVRTKVRRARKFTVLHVRAVPATAATATLQLYNRERFIWRNARRARLDASGRASFKLRADRRYRARVTLSGAGSNGVVGTSRVIKIAPKSS